MIREWTVQAWRHARRAGFAAGVVALSVTLAATPAVPQTTEPPAATPDVAPNLRPYVPERAPSSSPTATSASAQASSAPKPVVPPKPRPRPATTAPAATGTAGTAQTAVAPARLPVGTPPFQPAPAPTGLPAYTATVTAAPVPLTPATPSALPIPVSSRVPGAPISAEDIETFTDSVVRSWMQRDHVLGVTVAVVQGNTPLLVKGYGYDQLAPARRVDPNTSLFRIGSITKAFTWIVARQEIEAGRIKPDAPLSEYVQSDIYAEDARYKPVTMNSLMAHTAGYEDTSLGHLFQLDPTRVKDTGSYFRRHPPHRVRDPGEFSSYSNFGAALAATVASETAKAKDVPSLMEARIFAPLGMDHTSLREPYNDRNPYFRDLPAPLSPGLVRDLSNGYVWDGATYRPQPFDHTLPLSGALGGSSTARDMARFMSLMLAGGQIDGVQLFDARSAAAFRTPMVKMPEGYNGWASGLMVRATPSGQIVYGHGGATLWFNSDMVLAPDMNLGIFISTNTQTGGALANSFPNLLLDHLNGDLVRPPLLPTPAMAYAQHRDYYRALKGQYVSTRRAYGGLEGAVTRLINTIQLSVDPDGRLIMDTPAGTSAYVPASATGFFLPQESEDPGPAGDLGGLHFLFNPNGTHVTAFETASNMMRYERIGWVHSPQTVGTLSTLIIMSCVVVWLSMVLVFTMNQRLTEAQARATLVSAFLSILWVAAILIFNHWKTEISDDPGSLLVKWPSFEVQLASWLALVATLGTLFQIFTYYFVYVEASRFSVADGWAQWQKIAHGLLLAFWLGYAVVLALWGALQPWSW